MPHLHSMFLFLYEVLCFGSWRACKSYLVGGMWALQLQVYHRDFWATTSYHSFLVFRSLPPWLFSLVTVPASLLRGPRLILVLEICSKLICSFIAGVSCWLGWELTAPQELWLWINQVFASFRYSRTPQTLTAAASSRTVCHLLWLNRRREKSRAGSFAGLQRSFWSARRKTMSRVMALSQMDSQHRIHSTRGNTRTLLLCLCRHLLAFPTLVPQHLGTQTDSASRRTASPDSRNTKAPQKWSNTMSPNKGPFGLLVWRTKTIQKNTHTPLTYAWFPTCRLSHPRLEILLDGCNVVHGQHFPCRWGCYICCFPAAGIMAEKIDCSLLEMPWYQLWVSSPAHCPYHCNLWIAIVDYCDCHCCSDLVCQVNVL